MPLIEHGGATVVGETAQDGGRTSSYLSKWTRGGTYSDTVTNKQEVGSFPYTVANKGN